MPRTSSACSKRAAPRFCSRWTGVTFSERSSPDGTDGAAISTDWPSSPNGASKAWPPAWSPRRKLHSQRAVVRASPPLCISSSATPRPSGPRSATSTTPKWDGSSATSAAADLLAVALDSAGVADFGGVGVLAFVAEGPALAEQVPALVEGDLDLLQPVPVGLA